MIMKALRFFFFSLLAAFSFAASAQTIEVYKDGRVIDSFSATQVDSVVYAPAAAQPRYYYYAGWTKPSESNWPNIAEEPNGGYIGTSYAGFSHDYTVRANQLHNEEQENVYVVVPGDIEIWSSGLVNKISGTAFQVVNDVNIPNHTVYVSVRKFWDVDMIILIKK